MATVRLDRISDAYLLEENNEYVSAKRSAIVRIDKSTPGGVFFDALNDPAVPQPDSQLNASLPQLRVVRRECNYVGFFDDDTATIAILIEYEIQRDAAEATHRIGSTLQQITTQKDRAGAAITVTHNGDEQGGEITVLQPQRTITYPRAVATNDPIAEIEAWEDYTNADTWQGGAPGTWLVTRIDAEPAFLPDDASTPRYSFVYEFQYSPDGWDPTVVYTDSEGNIPPNLVDGQGIKTVDWYTSKSRNFAPDFPAIG